MSATTRVSPPQAPPPVGPVVKVTVPRRTLASELRAIRIVWQRELIRFAARNGEVVPAAKAPGRGAYTCRRLSCFERAAASQAFGRTLRQKVKVDPALGRLYTRDNG